MPTATIEMAQIQCYECSMPFWVPKYFQAQCLERKAGKSFFCPNGHRQHYTGESDLEKERRARQRAEQENARLAEQAVKAERAREQAEASLRRHQRRAAAGACPCCKRTFSNMARHMKSKHPDFNVVPMKAAQGIALKEDGR